MFPMELTQHVLPGFGVEGRHGRWPGVPQRGLFWGTELTPIGEGSRKAVSGNTSFCIWLMASFILTLPPGKAGRRTALL